MLSYFVYSLLEVHYPNIEFGMQVNNRLIIPNKFILKHDYFSRTMLIQKYHNDNNNNNNHIILILLFKKGATLYYLGRDADEFSILNIGKIGF